MMLRIVKKIIGFNAHRQFWNTTTNYIVTVFIESPNDPEIENNGSNEEKNSVGIGKYFGISTLLSFQIYWKNH